MRTAIFHHRRFLYWPVLILPLLFSLGVAAGDNQTVPQVQPDQPAQQVQPGTPMPVVQPDPPNILVNGDFQEGSKMWAGDLSDNNDDSDPNPMEAPPSGPLVLTLRAHRAIRLFQTFESDNGNLRIRVLYKLSDGAKFTGLGAVSQVASDIHKEPKYRTTFDGNGTTSTQVYDPDLNIYDSTFKGPVAILADVDEGHIIVHPLDDSWQGNDAIEVTPHRHYRLYIAFPPGDGTVSVSKVALFAHP